MKKLLPAVILIWILPILAIELTIFNPHSASFIAQLVLRPIDSLFLIFYLVAGFFVAWYCQALSQEDFNSAPELRTKGAKALANVISWIPASVYFYFFYVCFTDGFVGGWSPTKSVAEKIFFNFFTAFILLLNPLVWGLALVGAAVYILILKFLNRDKVK